MQMYFINGSYLREEEAKISVLDLGVLRGFGVFDYLRTYQGKPFHLWDHLLRLQYSARTLGLELPYSLEEISAIIATLLKKHPYPESSIKIVLTGGVSSDQLLPQEKPSLIIFVYPLNPSPSHFYSAGVKVITTPLSRSLPDCKTIQYIPAIVALQKGRLTQAHEALYLNAKGEILEATTSNFFGVKGDTLYTCCSDEVLAGITREVLLKRIAAPFPCRQEAIPYADIIHLDEAFLTSSNREVMPIVQIDEHRVGEGKVGPVTSTIMRLFAEYTQQDLWPTLHIPRYS